MTRAFTHTGLAVALVLAPTLCCCKAGWFAPAAPHARLATLVAGQHVPAQTPQQVESCCLNAKKTCCDSTSHDHPSKPSEKPAPAHSPECACCAERPDATPPESFVAESDPQPTGELLSLALVGLLGYPEHAGAVWVSHPPDGTGADARYSALFERHVLRC